MAQGKRNSLEDFWKYVVKDGPIPAHKPELGCCWTWTGTIDKSQGYAYFSCAGERLAAHRVAYELVKGPIPPDKQIDHLCRNRACPRPSHFEAVTRRVNILRGESPFAVNRRKKKCINGHPLSGRNLQIRVREGQERRQCRKCMRELSKKHIRLRSEMLRARRLEREAALERGVSGGEK
jgi:hypothetical protein